MAEKKEKKIVSASSGSTVSAAKKGTPSATAVKQAPATGSSAGYRIGAVVLWVLAIAAEILGLLIILGKVSISFLPITTMWQLIIVLVIDLALVIVGSQLWKKANHIHPASEANKVAFWLWNNMGVIVCVIAFVPFIIVMLCSKNVDKKTKAIATVVAVVALLIGGVSSYDFNPVSAEQKDAAVEALGTAQVYWAPFGKVYHTSPDCQALNQSDELTQGTVDEAIAANRTRLCSFCAKRDDITGVVTDDADASAQDATVPEEDSVAADDADVSSAAA